MPVPYRRTAHRRLSGCQGRRRTSRGARRWQIRLDSAAVTEFVVAGTLDGADAGVLLTAVEDGKAGEINGTGRIDHKVGIVLHAGMLEDVPDEAVFLVAAEGSIPVAVGVPVAVGREHPAIVIGAIIQTGIVLEVILCQIVGIGNQDAAVVIVRRAVEVVVPVALFRTIGQNGVQAGGLTLGIGHAEDEVDKAVAGADGGFERPDEFVLGAGVKDPVDAGVARDLVHTGDVLQLEDKIRQ